GALLKDSSGSSNDAFGSAVGILILRRGKDVEASLLEIFRIRRRQRGALHFSAQQCIQMTLPGRSYPHPLHIALQVQSCFTQLNLLHLVANTIVVADADSIAL